MLTSKLWEIRSAAMAIAIYNIAIVTLYNTATDIYSIAIVVFNLATVVYKLEHCYF